MLAKYKPSGRFGAMTLFIIPCLLVAAGVLGGIYQFAIELIPFIYINFFVMIFAAVAAMWIVNWGMGAGRCRNVAVAAAVGALASACAVAVSHWVAYRSAIAGVNVPVSFFEYVRVKVDSGWTIGGRSSAATGGGFSISGVFVWIVWLIEAGAFLIGGLVGGAMRAGGTAYCEPCGMWVRKKQHQVTLAGVQPGVIEQVERAADVEQLLDLPVGGFGQGPLELIYTLGGCQKCEALAVLTIDLNTISVDRHGKESRDKKTLHENILLEPEEVAAVRELAVLGQPATPAEPPANNPA